MMSEKIAVILVNYESGEDLLGALRSLMVARRAPDVYIVIDNASKDQSWKQAQRVFPHIKSRGNAQNIGFARAVNQGLKEAQQQGATHVWLFNPDARAYGDTLEQLIAASRRMPRALLSPVIFNQRKEFWFAGGEIDWLRMRAVHTRTVPSEQRQQGFLTGCALFMPLSVRESIGGLDERFFLYYEDVEYSFRAQQAGFDLRVVPDARVDHAEVSQANPEKTYFLVYSGLLFFLGQAKSVTRLYFSMYVIIRRLKNWVDCLLWGGKKAVSVRQAYGDFFRKK